MSTVSDALLALAVNLGTDELKIVQPIVDNALASIIANPDPINDVAQLKNIEVQVVTALPQMANAAAHDVAVALKSLIDLEASAILTKVAAAAAPTSVATVSVSTTGNDSATS